MTDLENELPAYRLAPPSAQLDRRMEALFESEVRRQADARRSSRGWWLILPAAGAAAAALYLLSRPPLPPREVLPVVHRFEPQGRLREWLQTPPARAQTPPVMLVNLQP